MAAFLANVGVNAQHRVRSPIRLDGSFVLHPIPEQRPWAPPMRRLPDVWGESAVHLDPDLRGDPPTYGDNCRTARRAFSLRRAQPGDVILFLARLHDADTSQSGFFLVGALTIAQVMPDVIADPGRGWWDGNAHVLRSRAGAAWDSFWVFRGANPSQLFDKAAPFTKAEADHVFDHAWQWQANRTELQTIGSYTRTVRRLEDAQECRIRELIP
jgi:hypothetical protein